MSTIGADEAVRPGSERPSSWTTPGTDSNVAAPTQFVAANNERYAYRRFGKATGHPLLFLQHFTGTLDNWDPAVTVTLAVGEATMLPAS